MTEGITDFQQAFIDSIVHAVERGERVVLCIPAPSGRRRLVEAVEALGHVEGTLVFG